MADKQLILLSINKENQAELVINGGLTDADFISNLTFMAGTLGSILHAWSVMQAENTNLTPEEIVKMGQIAFKEYMKKNNIEDRIQRKLNS